MREHLRCPMRIAIALGVFVLSASAASGAESPEGRPLAWARFEKGTHVQTYEGRPYLWLGTVEIELKIDVKPGRGHDLWLLWGSKNDTRGASVVVNGKTVKASGGGYNGFRWLRVPVPEDVTGTNYRIVLKRGAGKEAFISEVRLAGRDEGGDVPDMKAAAHKVALKVKPLSGAPRAGGGVAFPEMQKVWDTPLPPPARPLEDKDVEAAFRIAERNGRQANEMFFRCRKFVDGWLAHADPVTGLIPRNLGRDRGIWNAKDSAADNYPFMVLTCALTDREMFDGRMLDMLRTETRVTSRVDRLPDTYSFGKRGFASGRVNMGSIMFGASEYVKDGLLPLTEWLGASPWCDRMIGIVDDMWKHAPVDTPFGRIVSTNFEVNGEMLQALSRIYWMTGDRKYLQWAVRLGDYYLLGDRHPTRNGTRLSLDDHGCEAISGLCELYAAVHAAAPGKKKAYERAIHDLLDRILEIGRTPHGLFYDWVNVKTGQHARSLTDNWGYNLNGVYTVYLIDKTPEYRRAVVKALGGLREHYIDYRWEGGIADGYADSIEGGINLYNREPVASAVDWIDSEIKDMWHKQRPDGVVEGWHGDGNSARTGIMYALFKTRGVTARPWRKDLRFGTSESGGAQCISLFADEPWRGALLFDRPRHRVQMHLPVDYPRINQFPEWFTVEAEKRYVVSDLTEGTRKTSTGRRLAEGLRVELGGGVEKRLTVGASGK